MKRALLALAALSLIAAPAHADKVWKYDDGPDDLGTLQGSKMHPQYAHPGFVQQEAFGVLFKPKKSDYPLTIKGIDLLMAASGSAADPKAMKINATFEIWNADNAGPEPNSKKPLWTVHTSELFNPTTGKPGTPIQGNTVMQLQFTSAKKGDKPPAIQKGNVWIMVRLTTKATDESVYWNKLDCAKQSIGGIDVGCGCQKLAALTDTDTTLGTQIMNIVWPLGTCSGSKAWKFVEQLKSGTGFQMKGDFRLRMRTDGASGSSSGGTSSGGSTSGSSGGGADAGSTGPIDTYTPPVKPVLNLVSPSEGVEGEITSITIIGSGFQQGATVLVGAKSASVDKTTETKIEASILPGLKPGKYAIIVENPNKQTGFLKDAFTITAKPEVDAGGTDAGKPIDAGTDAGPGEKLKIEGVQIDGCASSDADKAITIFGRGFGTGLIIKVDGKPLKALQVETSTKAVALVPAGLSSGKKTLVAEQEGQDAFLADAFQVDCAVAAPPSSGGCSATQDPNHGAPIALLVMVGLGAVLIRRKYA